MKNALLAIIALFLFCRTQTALGSDFAVPSLGTIVQNADTIVKGRFFSDKSNVVFHVESSVKGKYRPLQTVRITGAGGNIFFDLARYTAQLHGQQCFVLGADRNSAIFLPWNSFSVWPQGVSQKWPTFGNVDTCAVFISALLEYERLVQSDESNLVKHLLGGLQTDASRPAALAYLDSNPSIFQNNKSLERDVLSIVAARMSSNRIYDDWTSSCLFSLSPSMPPSITVPYFMEVARRGGSQGALAQSAVESTLKVRNLIDHNARDRAELSTIVAAALPSLRAIDAKWNEHLLDATNSDIATSAPLVFSEIFGEPRPTGKSNSEEKSFWMGKISDHQK